MLVLLPVVQLREAKRHNPRAFGHMGQQPYATPDSANTGFDSVQAVCHDSRKV